MPAIVLHIFYFKALKINQMSNNFVNNFEFLNKGFIILIFLVVFKGKKCMKKEIK